MTTASSAPKLDAFATLAKEEETRGIKNLNILVSNTLDSASKSSLNKLTTEDYENQLKKYLSSNQSCSLIQQGSL